MSKLNEMQQLAVETTEGPLLILAGAGSGKTTVLVNRIARIISEGLARPWNILAITFTNKAAAELKMRIEKMDCDSDGIWASTFHTACLRILRGEVEKLGYKKNFIIYDRADQLTVIKECIRNLNLDEKIFVPKAILNEIGRAKDSLKTPKVFAEEAQGEYRRTLISKIYALYQEKLKAFNAMDFDDMIMQTVTLLEKDEEVLRFYQNKFKYILVDEYQDTNHAQYRLISLFGDGYKNVCVVGDDDQSIYKFRGANIENILRFEEHYSDAKVIKLEQNYRSSQNILDAANSVISNNMGRKGKSLWTSNGVGEKITVQKCPNEYEEGHFIAERVEELRSKLSLDYKDFVVLYRMNSQSRVVEEMLIKSAIPYRVLAGTRFYDRKEIKDMIAYLRLIFNTSDNASFVRIVNEPKRGIGKTTVEHALNIADGLSVFDVAKDAAKYAELQRSAAKLKVFTDIIDNLRRHVDQELLTEFMIRVMNETEYLNALKFEKTTESQTRVENLQEFLSIAQNYEQTNEQPTLGGFLEHIALFSDIDGYDEEQDSVVLMTLHAAKGLEFPVVFIVGAEEGVFPGYQSNLDSEEMEEERRLCYVGITRAKQKLFITHTDSRTIFGSTSRNRRSRFIEEIPHDLIESSFKQRQNIISVARQPERSISFDFAEGQRVRHRKFGEGFIISMQPVGADWRLEIAFDDVGTKNLMAAYANLEKIH